MSRLMKHKRKGIGIIIDVYTAYTLRKRDRYKENTNTVCICFFIHLSKKNIEQWSHRLETFISIHRPMIIHFKIWQRQTKQKKERACVHCLYGNIFIDVI